MKKVLIIIILIFCNFIYLFGNNSESIKINMLIFLSENCVICDDFQIHYLPDLESKYHLEYTLYYDYVLHGYANEKIARHIYHP